MADTDISAESKAGYVPQSTTWNPFARSESPAQYAPTTPGLRVSGKGDFGQRPDETSDAYSMRQENDRRILYGRIGTSRQQPLLNPGNPSDVAGLRAQRNAELKAPARVNPLFNRDAQIADWQKSQPKSRNEIFGDAITRGLTSFFNSALDAQGKAAQSFTPRNFINTTGNPNGPIAPPLARPQPAQGLKILPVVRDMATEGAALPPAQPVPGIRPTGKTISGDMAAGAQPDTSLPLAPVQDWKMHSVARDGSETFGDGRRVVTLQPDELAEADKFPHGRDAYIQNLLAGNVGNPDELTHNAYNPADDTAAQAASAATQRGNYTGPGLRGGVARSQGMEGLDEAALKSSKFNRNPLNEAAQAAKTDEAKAQRKAEWDEFNATAAERTGPGGAGQIGLRERGRNDQITARREANKRDVDVAEAAGEAKTAQIEAAHPEKRETNKGRFQIHAEKLPGKDAGSVLRVFDNEKQEFTDEAHMPPDEAWLAYKQGIEDNKRGFLNAKVFHAFGSDYAEFDKAAKDKLNQLWKVANPGVPISKAPHITGKLKEKDLAQFEPKEQGGDNIPTMTAQEASKAPVGTRFKGTDGVVRVVKQSKANS